MRSSSLNKRNNLFIAFFFFVFGSLNQGVATAFTTLSPSSLLLSTRTINFPKTLQNNKHQKNIIRQTLKSPLFSSSKWDNLIDPDEEEEEDFDSDDPEYTSQYSQSLQVYPDMKYVIPNMKRQANTFDALVDVGGLDIMHDVYLRNVDMKGKGKEGYELWLVGKVARISDVSPEQAIERQWPLIERHAWTLRLPVFSFSTSSSSSSSELSLPSMEVWYAPGDSEYEAAKNDPSVVFTKVLPEKCIGAKDVNRSFVGFVGKAYGSGEPPLFVLRDEEGKTVLPEMDGEWEEEQ